MIILELVIYIKNQIQKNIPKDVIISNLIKTGWYLDDIKKALLEVAKIPPITEAIAEISNQEKKEKTDIYREQIKDEVNENVLPKSLPIPVSVLPKPEHISKPELIPTPAPTLPVFIPPPISVPIQQTIKNELPKDWSSTKIEPLVKIKPKVIINTNIFSIPSVSHINTQTNIIKAENDELIPSLIPKINIPKHPPSEEENFINNNKIETFFIDQPDPHHLSNMAMTSSYAKDFLMANKPSNENKTFWSKNLFLLKWILFLLIPIIIIIGVFFIFKKGYIKLPEFRIPLIQENPKDILINSPNILSLLTSYKTETKINISFLPLKESNLENSISINSFGMVNQKKSPTSASDSILKIQGLIFEDDFNINLKKTGPVLFVAPYQLGHFFEKKYYGEEMLAIKEGEFDLIKPTLTIDFQDQIKNIDVYKFLSISLFSYLDNEIIEFYKNYIDNLNIKNEKTEEILGIKTYFYNLNIDTVEIKKLLKQIMSIFMIDSSVENKNNLNETIDSMIIDSFGVWISKEGNSLFKFKIIFKAPLLKIFKKIPDGIIDADQVEIDWQIIYYDFDILNKIKMPEKIISPEEFIKSDKI